jgi:hypothetical protein
MAAWRKISTSSSLTSGAALRCFVLLFRRVSSVAFLFAIGGPPRGTLVYARRPPDGLTSISRRIAAACSGGTGLM